MGDPSFSTNDAIHFNSNDHSMEHFSFMPIDYVSNNMNRLLKETYLIHKLDTLHPKGLNAKVLYKTYILQFHLVLCCYFHFIHYYRTSFLLKLLHHLL